MNEQINFCWKKQRKYLDKYLETLLKMKINEKMRQAEIKIYNKQVK